jgi:hypothetical protein
VLLALPGQVPDRATPDRHLAPGKGCQRGGLRRGR